jgi:hypothetical protein
MTTKHAVTDDLSALKLRVNALRQEFIDYKRTEDVQADMENLRVRDNGGSEGAVLKLIGGSRSGKTKIISDYVSRYPAVPKGRQLGDGAFADLREVVCIRVPDTSVKDLLERLLAELSNRTLREVTSRGFKRFVVQDEVLDYAKKVGLKLLVLEEAHQGIDGKEDKAVNLVASIFKDMTNTGGFSLAIAGTAAANRLFEVNSELDGRTIYTHELSPLRWEVLTERQWFVTVLTGLDQYLRDEVFGQLSGLAEDTIAEALLRAGRGQIGHAATLLESAATSAVEDIVAGRAKGLTVNHLAKALSKSPLGQYNPDAFADLVVPVGAVAITPPVVPTRNKGRSHRSARDAAFRP